MPWLKSFSKITNAITIEEKKIHPLFHRRQEDRKPSIHAII